jgi:hypothetical protein
MIEFIIALMMKMPLAVGVVLISMTMGAAWNPQLFPSSSS